MSKKLGLLSVCLFVMGAFVFVNTGLAKTWFLPEYMEKLPNTFRKRVNDSDTPTVAASECARFKDSAGRPLLAPNEIPSGQVCTSYPNAVINKNCVGNCKCDPSKFIYNSSNCNGDYKLGGTLCNDGTARGTQCLCDTGKYGSVINGTTCKFPDTSAGVCKDKPSNTAHYVKCYADTCWKYSNLVDKGDASCKWGCPTYVDANCPKCSASSCYTDDCHLYNHPAVSSCQWGCKTTSSTICTSKCAECWPDNCRNVTDNKTDLGCDETYGAECPTKCKKGKICTPRNCKDEGYSLSSCPPNADCGEPCTDPCDNSGTKYYKYGTCKPGYIDLETYWCNGAVKCWWNGEFGTKTPVSCSDLGYTRHCTQEPCAYCFVGQTVEKCPSDNSYFKCTGTPDCTVLGYNLKKTSGSLHVCLTGQTREDCPYDSNYYKCNGTATLPEPVDCDGYSDCSTVFCLGTKLTCPTDTSKCKCDDSCPSGTFMPSDDEACDCPYGITPSGTLNCYRCGTYSECGSDSITKCIQCNKLGAKS